MKKLILVVLFSLLTYPIIAQEDNVIYSFETSKHKVIQLIYNELDGIFIFRLLSRNMIVLEVRDNLRDNNIIFSVSGYHRGGGLENAAMDYNNVVFSHKGFDYDIYYVWSVGEKKANYDTDPIFGVRVIKDGVEIDDMRGCKVITGEAYGWSFYDILPETKAD